MQEILSRLPPEDFEYIIFGNDCILHQPIEEWPIVHCLLAFFSSGFPLRKAEEYVRLRQPFCVNDLATEHILRDRRFFYRRLEEFGIPVAPHIMLDRDRPEEEQPTVVEHEDFLVIGGRRIFKPFVEKPVDAENHNIRIYYPRRMGGGCKQLFRKVKNRSSEFHPEINTVRRTGSYIYEQFLMTQGTDIKVYAVGPDYAHAEARKSPAVDGIVQRDSDGKEVRFPIMLTAQEKEVARRVVLAFRQNVCGFDLLRTPNCSYVCDVNGWSFVKKSQKYYEDASQLLAIMMIQAVDPRRLEARAMRFFSLPAGVVGPGDLSLPPRGLAASNDDDSVSSVSSSEDSTGGEEELRCVVAVIRHGDRTPKQKLKMKVSDQRFVELHRRFASHPREEAKLKSAQQLQPVLDISRDILLDPQSADMYGSEEAVESLRKLRQVQTVLEMGRGFSGINRKVQLKPTKWRPRTPSGDERVGDDETGGAEGDGGGNEVPDRERALPSHGDEVRFQTVSQRGNAGDTSEEVDSCTKRRSSRAGSTHGGSMATSRRHSPELDEGSTTWERRPGDIGWDGRLAGDAAGSEPASEDGWATAEEVPCEFTLVVKWGGVLTEAGRRQAETLGRRFRHTMFPGDAMGLLRLHATYRHDLKIYSSDEGRVQMTAAAFVKGLLALEGSLTPILASLVRSSNTSSMLDDSNGANDAMARAKSLLREALLEDGEDSPSGAVDPEEQEQEQEGAEGARKYAVPEALVSKVAPTRDPSLLLALERIGAHPRKALRALHRVIGAVARELEGLLEQAEIEAKPDEEPLAQAVSQRLRGTSESSAASHGSSPQLDASSSETTQSRKTSTQGVVASVPQRLGRSASAGSLASVEARNANMEALIMMRNRWSKLESDFYDAKKDKFDLSKIPDVYDCVKHDALHNAHMRLRHLAPLYESACAFADLIIPQEYGVLASQKRWIGSTICHHLLRKIFFDMTAVKSDDVQGQRPQEENVTQSPPSAAGSRPARDGSIPARSPTSRGQVTQAMSPPPPLQHNACGLDVQEGPEGSSLDVGMPLGSPSESGREEGLVPAMTMPEQAHDNGEDSGGSKRTNGGQGMSSTGSGGVGGGGNEDDQRVTLPGSMGSPSQSNQNSEGSASAVGDLRDDALPGAPSLPPNVAEPEADDTGFLFDPEDADGFMILSGSSFAALPRCRSCPSLTTGIGQTPASRLSLADWNLLWVPFQALSIRNRHVTSTASGIYGTDGDDNRSPGNLSVNNDLDESRSLVERESVDGVGWAQYGSSALSHSHIGGSHDSLTEMQRGSMRNAVVGRHAGLLMRSVSMEEPSAPIPARSKAPTVPSSMAAPPPSAAVTDGVSAEGDRWERESAASATSGTAAQRARAWIVGNTNTGLSWSTAPGLGNPWYAWTAASPLQLLPNSGGARLGMSAPRQRRPSASSGAGASAGGRSRGEDLGESVFAAGGSAAGWSSASPVALSQGWPDTARDGSELSPARHGMSRVGTQGSLSGMERPSSAAPVSTTTATATGIAPTRDAQEPSVMLPASGTAVGPGSNPRAWHTRPAHWDAMRSGNTTHLPISSASSTRSDASAAYPSEGPYLVANPKGLQVLNRHAREKYRNWQRRLQRGKEHPQQRRRRRQQKAEGQPRGRVEARENWSRPAERTTAVAERDVKEHGKGRGNAKGRGKGRGRGRGGGRGGGGKGKEKAMPQSPVHIGSSTPQGFVSSMAEPSRAGEELSAPQFLRRSSSDSGPRSTTAAVETFPPPATAATLPDLSAAADWDTLGMPMQTTDAPREQSWDFEVQADVSRIEAASGPGPPVESTPAPPTTTTPPPWYPSLSDPGEAPGATVGAGEVERGEPASQAAVATTLASTEPEGNMDALPSTSWISEGDHILRDLHETVHQLDQDRMGPGRGYADIPTPSQHVRTRLYFTSESHVHCLSNVLRLFGRGIEESESEDDDDKPPIPASLITEEGRKALESVPELDYCTHIVFRLYERVREPIDSPERHRVEVLFSPGAAFSPFDGTARSPYHGVHDKDCGEPSTLSLVRKPLGSRGAGLRGVPLAPGGGSGGREGDRVSSVSGSAQVLSRSKGDVSGSADRGGGGGGGGGDQGGVSPEEEGSMPWHRQPGDRIAADWHRYRAGRSRDTVASTALASLPSMRHPLMEPTVQLPPSDSFVRPNPSAPTTTSTETSGAAATEAMMRGEPTAPRAMMMAESDVVRFAMESSSTVPVTTTGSGEAAAVLAGPAEATERDLREGFLPVSRLVPLVSSLPLHHFEEFFAHVIMAPGAPHPMDERTTGPGEEFMSPERSGDPSRKLLGKARGKGKPNPLL